MIELLDSAGFRLVGYGVAALAALVAARREQRSAPGEKRGQWPTFWLLSALLLGAMAIARAADVGDLITDVGRDRIESDWYDIRRSFQPLLIGIVAGFWAISVSVATWRVPERQRRYLPAAVMLGALVSFAAVRVVSFHYVDAVLYRRDLLGVRFVAIVELALLAGTVAVMFWFPFVQLAGNDRENPPA